MKNSIIKFISGAASVAVALSGCVKADYTSGTDHPLQSQITVNADWSTTGDGVTVPGNVNILQDGKNVTPTPGGTLPLVDPGDYRIVVYNEAEHINVTSQLPVPPATKGGTLATLPVDADGFVTAMPNWFFSGCIDLKVERDSDYSHTMQMQQQIRELNFDLTITEGVPSRITSITAQLTGVAGGWDLVANTPYGEAVKVKPVFTHSGAKLIAQVRLFGIQGASQILTLDLTFTDGRTQKIISNISTQLTGFNANKPQPMTLLGNVQTPIASEPSGTITDWTVITDNINVH